MVLASRAQREQDYGARQEKACGEEGMRRGGAAGAVRADVASALAS